MFRSLASSLISFSGILVLAFMLLFVWSGSEGMQFSRVAMDGDRSTAKVLEDYRRERMAEMEAAVVRTSDEPAAPQPRENLGDGPPVVVWVSIPGFRGDYLERSNTPFFDKLVSDGGATNKMRPQFPCLTFPAHATMATGVPPSGHGILADRIRIAPGETVVEPLDSALLEAEPIWTTATRQGIRTLVHDWPLSQNQTGEHAAAHFLDSFDPESTDETRLARALSEWRADAAPAAAPAAASEGDESSSDDGGDNGDAAGAEEEADAAADGGEAERIRLVMLRLDDVLRAGLVHGPRADETYAAVSATDKALKDFVDTLEREWEALAPPNANLYLFVTTDHGMAEIERNVNIAHLLGDEMMANADIVAHDAVANLFFKDLPESEGERNIFTNRFDAELGRRIYFRTLTKEDIPAAWNYQHPERTGDRILVLKTGYAFSDHRAEEPVFEPTEGDGHFGGFGYPVEESIRMSGQVFLAGYPNSPATGDLGEISQLTFHATVCKLLGIEPAPGAGTEALPVRD